MESSEMRRLVIDSAFVTQMLLKKGFEKIDTYLKEFGLVRTHASILYTLLYSHELTMSDLSKRLYVTKPNITLLVDKLEKLNLVERVNTSEDRRIFLIRLSEKGNVFIQEHTDRLVESYMDTFKNLDEKEMKLFKESIATLKSLMLKL